MQAEFCKSLHVGAPVGETRRKLFRKPLDPSLPVPAAIIGAERISGESLIKIHQEVTIFIGLAEPLAPTVEHLLKFKTVRRKPGKHHKTQIGLLVFEGLRGLFRYGGLFAGTRGIHGDFLNPQFTGHFAQAADQPAVKVGGSIERKRNGFPVEIPAQIERLGEFFPLSGKISHQHEPDSLPVCPRL